MALRLTREEFHRWAEGQTQRYERVGGEPIAMSPERIQHVRIKSRVWAALDRAVREGGLDCEALGDGVTIEVDEDTDYEPDALVNCGPRLPPDATAATNPVIVVEVLSPSTEKYDRSDKQRIYARYGVGHVWHVNPITRLLEVYVRQDKAWLQAHVFKDLDLVSAPPFESLSFNLGLLWPFDQPST